MVRASARACITVYEDSVAHRQAIWYTEDTIGKGSILYWKYKTIYNGIPLAVCQPADDCPAYLSLTYRFYHLIHCVARKGLSKKADSPKNFGIEDQISSSAHIFRTV